MKRTVIILAAALAVCSAVPATATSVEHLVGTAGGVTTYSYTLISDEAGDYITSFHVYSPTVAELITDFSAPYGWTFSSAPDPEGGIDIGWTADPDVSPGLANGERLSVSISTSSLVPTVSNYVLPDYLGNWGYETEQWAQWGVGVLVMYSSIPVPDSATVAPEPLSIVVLGAGCLLLAPWRRR